MRPITIQFLKLLLICTLLLSSASLSTAAQAQVAMYWSPPAKIPGLNDSGLDPIFLADSEGTIHLFHSQPIGENLSIFYIRWTREEGWSNLVDVIKAPQGDARVYGVHLDQQGWLHLVFFGGDDLAANIFYTKVPASSAGKSTAWLEPVLIGSAAITPSNAAMIGDGKGFLLVTYSGNAKGNGLYTVQSQDGGQTWSLPKTLFITYNDRLWPFSFKISQGSAGRIYATWSVKDEIGVAQALYFSRYELKDGQWTPAKLIAEAIGFQADTPALIEHQGQLILVYHNDFPTTRWMQLSADGGETWSRPTHLFEHVGSNGAAALAVDSRQQLYLLFGNRVGDPAIHGAWQSEWQEDHWGRPTAIVSGRQIVRGLDGEEGFDPSFVQATVVQGNILFALWRHDPQAGPINIWYSYRELDAPEIPFQPLPTIILTPTPIATPTSSPTAAPTATSEPDISTSTASATSGNDAQANPDLGNPNISILLGIVPVGLLIVIAIVIRKRQK